MRVVGRTTQHYEPADLYPRLTTAEWDAIINAVALLDTELDAEAKQRQRTTLDRGFRKLQNWQEKTDG